MAGARTGASTCFRIFETAAPFGGVITSLLHACISYAAWHLFAVPL
jgi:hypothetical protein